MGTAYGYACSRSRRPWLAAPKPPAYPGSRPRLTNTPTVPRARTLPGSGARQPAAELAEEGITVHAASPCWTSTDLGGEGGRPIVDGAASIKHVVNLPADAGTGHDYQDEQTRCAAGCCTAATAAVLMAVLKRN